MSGILNLNKNDILDLTKKDPGLDKIMLGAGWDVTKKGLFSIGKKDYDLDLVAILLDENGKLTKQENVICYSNMRQQGITLHGDNRTGEGSGDDEQITVELSKLQNTCSKVIFAVTIYDAIKRKQSFDQVNNAYIRLLNQEKRNTEICRFNLSDHANGKTALVFAELYNENGSWNFKAIGELYNANITQLAKNYL
ncbi:MAG: TerD family protein [Sarcina sp.]